MQENQKISRIINEFSLFILENHSDNFNFSINLIDSTFVLKFTTDRIEGELREKLETELIPEHDFDLEEYGWEICGDGDGTDDLALIGALIDSVEYVDTDKETSVIMKRKLR